MMKTKIDKTPNEKLKEFIVDDKERRRRINMTKIESLVKKEEKEKSKNQQCTFEEKILTNINR